MYRVIEKETGLFLRDDFTFDDELEIGLEVEPAQGFIWPKWDFDSEKWIEYGKTPDFITQASEED